MATTIKTTPTTGIVCAKHATDIFLSFSKLIRQKYIWEVEHITWFSVHWFSFYERLYWRNLEVGVGRRTIWGVKRVCVCRGVVGGSWGGWGVGWIANYLCRCRWPRLGRGVGRGAQAVCGLWLHFACSTIVDPLSHAKSTPTVMSNLFVQL